jgi:hypothetical protein
MKLYIDDLGFLARFAFIVAFQVAALVAVGDETLFVLGALSLFGGLVTGFLKVISDEFTVYEDHQSEELVMLVFNFRVA